MSDEGKKADEATEESPPDAAKKEDTSGALDPKEAFAQGMGLLWHAARGALGGLKKEIEKADIPTELRKAADEMKRAADAAVRGKPREPEPDWVQPEKGTRIQTDDEPSKADENAAEDEPKVPEGDGGSSQDDAK